MTKGAAEILDVTPGYVRRLAQAGLLPLVATLPDGQRVFDAAALRQLVRTRQRQADDAVAHREHAAAAESNQSVDLPTLRQIAEHWQRRAGAVRARHDRAGAAVGEWNDEGSAA